MREARADPDELLRRVAAEERRASRGELVIFFGAAPGVGKTYGMLEAARSERDLRRDVVIGVVETHGRFDTGALVIGLELLPRRKANHRGVTVEEFDLDAALARKPGLILVDELAHTNAPGSRHAKRWQDVEELLDAGIDVYATLNVQHLASLNDVVAQITGVVVRETVPDRVLEEATEVRLIELPPDELLERLQEGKVYIPAQAQLAVESFFRKGNLIALRELALAEYGRARRRPDAPVQDRAWHPGHLADDRTSPRVRECQPLVRAPRASGAANGRQLASHLHRSVRRNAGVVADVGRRPPAPLGELAPRGAARRRARSVEGRARRPGDDPLRAGAECDQDRRREANAPALARLRLSVVSRRSREVERRHRRLRHLGGGGGTRNGLARAGAPEAEARSSRVRRQCGGRHRCHRHRVGAVRATAARRRGHDLSPRNHPRLFALRIWAVDRRGGGERPAPRLPLRASLPELCRLRFPARGDVRGHVRRGGRHQQSHPSRPHPGRRGAVSRTTHSEPLRRESRARRDASHPQPRNCRRAACARCLRGEGGRVAGGGRGPTRERRDPRPRFRGRGAGAQRRGMGLLERQGRRPRDRHAPIGGRTLRAAARPGAGPRRRPRALPSAGALYVPLRGAQGRVGVLGVQPNDPLRFQDAEQRTLLDVFASQIATALERSRLADQAQQATLQVEAERLRSSLLSSVSHDLRTPLSVITGAASALLQKEAALTPAARLDLAETVHEEARRLDRLVRNLLDMTRLASGAVKVAKEWQPIEGVIGAALGRLEDQLHGRTVDVRLPPDLPPVPIDGLLVEQVLINLLENAAKYTPSGTAIDIRATAGGDSLVVEIADRGPGIPRELVDRIFEKFYRLPKEGAGGGAGLGLAICRGIVEAHGGRIWAENRDGGGATFRFALPMDGPPPELAPEDVS